MAEVGHTVAQFIYVLEKARKAHGDKLILDNVTLAFLPGAKIGVLGPNGAGKSSLLRIMAGLDVPSNGEARLMPGYTVGLLAQEPQLDESKTVLGNIEGAVAETKAKLARFNEIAELMATEYSDELMAEMGQLQEELDHADAWDVDSKLELAMDALRCPPPEADVRVLSGGERRRVALCRLLLEQPDLLLLDEPTNHLDAESVQWLEQHLAKYAGTVVAITHDRYFLDHVAEWILELEEIQIPPGPRLGSRVVEVTDLAKGFDGRTLIEHLSFSLPRNGIVGIIGPNGVGKTTLFYMLIGLEKPDAGEIRVGETVSVSYVDQNRAGIDPTKTVWQVVSDGLDHLMVGKVEMPSRAYVAAFGFKGPDQQKPAGVLSGGERNRLNLALTLKIGGNLLLLDEPTNDLDVETLSSLENALLEFPGCAVVISHDRMFLDRVATHILAWEGDDENPAKWFWFEGNFEAYEKNKVDRLGAEAARPHRVTYRKLMRD